MSKQDFYEILGVPKNANDDEIKKAYRNAAKQYHPDLNPGDKDAEAKFKQANEAYEILSDSSKRANYDQFGHAGVDPNYGAGGGGYGPFGDGVDFDLGDIFGSFFGGGRARANPNAAQVGSDIEISLNLTFEEAALGCVKSATFNRVESCKTCNGDGCAAGSSPKTCETCKGSGQVRINQRTPFGVMQTSRTCTTCNGKGKIIENPCGTCNGNGRVRAKFTKEIKVPAGIDYGQTLNIRGEGNAGINRGPSGDLLVHISIAPHPIFKRNGHHVLVDVPISMTQAALGAEITVPTLSGLAKFKVPEGTQPNEVVKLKGKGMQRINSGAMGDLFVTLVVEIPKKVGEKERVKLREVEEKLGDSSYKNRKKFNSKLKDLYK